MKNVKITDVSYMTGLIAVICMALTLASGYCITF